MDKRNYFFLIFTMELFSTVLKQLIAQSTLNLLEYLYNFKHKHKSNIKGATFELTSSDLLFDQAYKEVLEVKCQACNFTGVLYFTGVFADFGHIFPTCFLQNFSYLKNKKLTIILEVGKFSSYVTSLSTLFRKWQNFLLQS